MFINATCFDTRGVICGVQCLLLILISHLTNSLYCVNIVVKQEFEHNNVMDLWAEISVFTESNVYYLVSVLHVLAWRWPTWVERRCLNKQRNLVVLMVIIYTADKQVRVRRAVNEITVPWFWWFVHSSCPFISHEYSIS